MTVDYEALYAQLLPLARVVAPRGVDGADVLQEALTRALARHIAFTGLDEPLHLDVVTVATGAVREIARNSDVEQFEPAWSPDGTQIAFATENGIFATGADGRGRAQLAACVTPNCRPNEPTWSPDGTAIAYVSSGSGARQLFVAPVAGGSARQVTTGPNDVSTPAW